MSPKISQEGGLFLLGAGQYLDALTAIAAFRGEVQDICTGVYQHHAQEFAEQLGLEIEDCKPFQSDNAEKRRAQVGVMRSAQTECHLYLCLSWAEAEEIAGVIELFLYTKRLRDNLYEQLRRNNPRCRAMRLGTYSLSLSAPIKLDDLASTSEILDVLAQEWLGYCRSIGGLRLGQVKDGGRVGAAHLNVRVSKRGMRLRR